MSAAPEEYDEGWGDGFSGDIDEGALEEALSRFRRGDFEECLHHLEIALGSDWRGLADILQKRS